ncbi:MAG: hypothetical protein DCF19_20550 [Pseudanabaena frigida]|uniref:CHAT domain-containing protein n=1 Tax=Pseudanabaena frigida TaxID=945775 RepID=A0A2W4VXP9_9CYAN|nr:MAG: hypothetical protein DCF19_20550 [Pseudanabaena frigida]
MNLRDLSRQSLMAISLTVCPLAVSFLPLPQVILAVIAQTTTQTQASESKPIALVLQQAISRDLKGGESHSYVVSLKAGQFFHAIAEQKGIDLVILLYSPSGKLIAKSDTPNGRLGLESMSVLADSDGIYQLEINSPDSEAPAGKYILTVEELRAASSQDRNYIVAERAFMEAVQLDQANAQQTEVRKRQALSKYLESIPVFRVQGKHYWEMLATLQVGSIIADIGQPAKAIDYYQQALILANQIGDRTVEKDVFTSLGNASYYLGKYEEAIKYYQQTLEIAKQIGDRKAEASSLGNLGNVYNALGKYQKATDFLQQALSIIKQIDNRNGEAAVLNNLGLTYNYLGQYPKAIDYFQQALIIIKKIGDRSFEGTSINNLGVAYTSLGKYQKAIDYFQQSLAISKQIGDINITVNSLNNLGAAYMSLSQYLKAIDYFQQSLTISKQIGDRKGEGTSLNNLGLIFYYLGQYPKAIDFYQQSLVVFKQISDRNSEGLNLNNLGAAYMGLSQYPKAIDYFQQALAIAQQIGNRNGEGTSLNNLGGAYMSLSQYQKAIDFYQQSLAITQQIGDRNGEGLNLNNLGDVYAHLGQYQKAIDFYQQSLAITQQIGNRNGEGKSLNNLGLIYDNLGQYQKAIDFYQQSLAISQQISDRQGEAASLNNLGSVYKNLGQYQKAIDFYQQSLAISQQIGDRNSEGASLSNLGLASDNLGQYQKAIDFYQQSLAIKKQIGDRKGEGTSLNNLGSVHDNLGQYQKAIGFYQQSLAIAQQIGERNVEGTSLNNLGSVYKHLAQYQKAIDYHQQSLAIFKQIGDREGEAASLNNLGSVYDNLGQYQKAIDFYQQSLAIKKQIGDRNGEGRSLNNLGNVYNSLGQYQKAIDYHQQSLAIAQQIGDRHGEATSLNNLGEAYSSLGQYRKAIDYHQQSLAISQQIGNRSSEATSLNNLGAVSYRLGQYQKAIDYFQQALAIKKQIGVRNSEGLTLSNLGSSFSKLNQPELAILFFKQSVNVTESIRKDIRGLSKEEQKSYLSTIEDTYRALAGILLKQDRILEAQQVLDLLKVQELSDYLRTVRGNNDTAKGVDLQRPEQNIIALAIELDELQKRKLANNITASEQERLNQLVQSEREQNKQFTAFLNSPAVQKLVDELRRTEEQQNIDTKNLRNLRTDILTQHPNAVLLYPLILDDRLELILITAKTPLIRRTVNIKREDLNQEIYEFRVGLKDKTSEDVKKPAQQLYKWLIAPFASELAQLKIDTIIYAPDGQLRYIPLAALYDGKQWLVEKYRINNITAASLTKFNKPAIATPKIFAGAFGNVNKAGFAELPATLSEVKKIADRFPNTSTFVETAFTKNVTENNANSYTILHLATHGQLFNGKPEDSFILFGDGTKATISDIRDWALTNVDLVVLSACQSGLGTKLGTGVEILGLGYQMQAAGARVAIASLWKVDDAGTQVLMDVFYGELKKGDVPIAEALQRAQIAMINSDKQGTGSDRAGVRVVGTVPSSSSLSHPYYWSAFFAIGNGL